MNKKLALLVFLILVVRIGYSQLGNIEAVNNTVKNTITYQMLNDFKTTVPLLFIAPGFAFAGSVDIFRIPVFVENEYYNLFNKYDFR